MSKFNKFKSDDPHDIILTINVGGRIFTCRRSTLCLDAESTLAKMFNPTSPCRSLDCDSCGRPFLDRDGDSFAIVMDYLRRGQRLVGKANLPDNVYEMLLDEMDFYGLLDLHRKLVEQRKCEETTTTKKTKTEQKCHVIHGNIFSLNFNMALRAQSCIEDHEKDGWKVQCMLGGAHISGQDGTDPLLIVFVKESC
jgi:BTB/POZ domain